MATWTISALGNTEYLRRGGSARLSQAWQDAIDAALEELTTTSPEGCVIVLDGTPALLLPGRTDDGDLDLPATRAAAERMAVAAIGGLR